MSNDLDMTEIIKSIQNESATIIELENRIAKKNQEIGGLQLVCDLLKYEINSQLSFNAYQESALKTAIFGPVDHPSVLPFMNCFEAIGRIAERAKKSFRDNEGNFKSESQEEIWQSFETIRKEAPQAILSMTKASGGNGNSIIYPVFGLMGEAGEVASKVIKLVESPEYQITDKDREDLALECSDCLWYLSALADQLGYSFGEIAQMNLDKLKSRQERNKIHGEGDNR